MRRRSLLVSLSAASAGLAGCSLPSSEAETPSGDTPANGQPTETPTDEEPTFTPPESRSNVVELETGPRTYAIGPMQFRTADNGSVTLWVDRTATADHPARLRGWLENANSFENTFRIDRIPAVGQVFSRQPSGYDHEARLHFAPTENNDLAETVPEVTRDSSGYWRVTDVGPWMTETHRMAPGERVALEYVLVGEPGLTGRPTGSYEFRGEGRTVTVTVWDSEHPGPETESRFAGRSLPTFENGGPVQWYHEAGSETRAFLRPSAERIELDGRIDFELVNNSEQGLRCGHWDLYKLVDGEWFHIGPNLHTADCRVLTPGGRKRWSLRAFGGEGVPCGHDGYGSEAGLTRGYLGGGEYAVVAGYGHPEGESGALVELAGQPVTLVPTADATVERDGATVTVTTDRYADDERPADAAFELQRASTADERVLAEQVMASGPIPGAGRGLRNGLSVLADDVDRVVVRTDQRVLDTVLGDEGDARRFRFRGQAYEVRVVGVAVDASG